MAGWSWRRAYTLALLTAGYIAGELAHFLINTTGRAVARDLHFGSQSCFPPTGPPPPLAPNCSAPGEEQCEALGCVWDYTGTGLEYQVLAGPAFVGVFSVSAVLLAVTSDRLGALVPRIVVFGLGTLMFSLALLGMGLATRYWHLVTARMLIAAGESVCRPMAGSLLADLFPPESRGLANGIFSWGVYWGYGLAFVLGIQGTEADILGYGWRAPYILGAVPGLLVALLCLVTLREPARERPAVARGSDQGAPPGWLRCGLVRSLASPALLLLLLAAMARHTAGLTWAYNTRPFFQHYYPHFDIGYWMLGASVAGGSFGVFAGGFLSDRVVSRLGLPSRLWLLALATLLAAPLAALVLLLPPPPAMAALAAYYLFAETWFAILFTVIVEVVPAGVRASAIGLFLFFMNQVGGNLPVAISPLREALGGDYRTALGVMWPGCLALSAVLFLVASLPLGCSRPDQEEGGPSPVEESGAPLLRPSPPPPHPHGAPAEEE